MVQDENEHEKIFIFQTFRSDQYKKFDIKRGIICNKGYYSDNTEYIHVFLGTKFKENGKNINFGIYLQKNGKLGYMYSAPDNLEKDCSFYNKLPIMTRIFLYTANEGNQIFFNDIFPFLDDCYWEQVFYKECQEAVLQFLMCCKFGNVSICKDIQQKIARYIYNMHNTWNKSIL